MGKKERIFKTFILFLLLLFGCSQKYVDDRGRSLEDKIIASWEELDCSIVARDEQGFSLVVKVKDVVFIGANQELKEVDMVDSDKREGSIVPFLFGSVVVVGGSCVGLKCTNFSDWSRDPRWVEGCVVSAASCALGLSIMKFGVSERPKSVKIIPDFIKKDAIRVDSAVISIDKVNILVENKNLEKTYYTDEKGIIELKFNEIIPEPAEADSVLGLIIQYEDLVDTVEVKIGL